MSRALTARLPGSSTHAIFLTALFAAVQLADAILTINGIHRFGVVAEGNPLIGLSMRTFGVAPAVATWKLFALGAGVILHVTERHLALALLTLMAVLAAAIPWSWILAF